MTAKANKEKPEVVDESMLQAVSIEEKIAPIGMRGYRQ